MIFSRIKKNNKKKEGEGGVREDFQAVLGTWGVSKLAGDDMAKIKH